MIADDRAKALRAEVALELALLRPLAPDAGARLAEVEDLIEQLGDAGPLYGRAFIALRRASSLGEAHPLAPRWRAVALAIIARANEAICGARRAVQPARRSRVSARLDGGQAPQHIGEILARIVPPAPPPVEREPDPWELCGRVEPAAPPDPPGRTPAVLLCQCGSAAIDIKEWITPHLPVLRCYTCGNEVRLPGFTVGRYYGPGSTEVLREARADAAVFLGGERRVS